MNCDTLMELLLTEPTHRFDEWAEHLEACPDCHALAERIRSTEEALRLEEESPMTTLTFDNAWAAADRQVQLRPQTRRGPLLALAAGLVLAVATWNLVPGGPPPEPVTHGVLPAVDLSDFEAIRPPSIDGLEGREQDTALQGALVQKAEAMKAAQTALTERYQAGSPSEKVDTLVAMGDLYDQMGAFLLELPYPTYLDAEQEEVYGYAVEDKAYVQFEKAREAWEKGVKTASPEQKRVLEARLATLKDRPAPVTDPVEAIEKRLKTFERELQKTEKKVRSLEKRCTVPSDLRMLMDQLEAFGADDFQQVSEIDELAEMLDKMVAEAETTCR